MKKPWLTGLLVLVVSIGAIAVCFIGYKVNAKKQYNQRVEYAAASATREAEIMDEVEEQLAALYTDDTQSYLNSDVTTESINELSTKLSSVKASADDFGIEDESLPTNLSELAERKQEASSIIKSAKQKLVLQDAISELFEKAVSNWQKPTNNVTIRTDLTEEEISELRDEITLVGDDWVTVANAYLDYAQAQLTRSTEIRTAIGIIYTDKKLTDKASYEEYYKIVDSIAQVRNEELKAEYETLTAEILELLKAGGYTDPNATVPQNNYDYNTDYNSWY